MANVFDLIHSQQFTNTDSIEVTHNGNLEWVGCQLIIDGEVRPDMILNAIPNSGDPKNKLTLTLSSQQTGIVQIFKPSLVIINSPTAEEKISIVSLGNFGAHFGKAESLDESSTTGTVWVQKLQLTTTNLPAGTYRLGWAYEWQMANSTFEFVSRVQQDDTTLLAEQMSRPADASSYTPSAGMVYMDLGAGDHHFDIDFKSSSTGKTASIKNARLELWRIE